MYPPRFNDSAESQVKLSDREIGRSVETYRDQVLFIRRNLSNARWTTPAKMLRGRSRGSLVPGFSDVGKKIIYK